MPLYIVRNDILKMQVDAIVNPTHNALLGGGRTDGAIHAAAGPQLDEECAKIGYCEAGKAVLTKGYNLTTCRYIIHTVGPVWQGGDANEEAILRSCYAEVLKLAWENECTSIAIPLISGGTYRFPKEKALNCATVEIRNFLKEKDLDVYLVVFDKDAYRISRTLFSEVRAYIDNHYVEQKHKEYAYEYDMYPEAWPDSLSDECSASNMREEPGLEQAPRPQKDSYSFQAPRPQKQPCSAPSAPLPKAGKKKGRPRIPEFWHRKEKEKDAKGEPFIGSIAPTEVYYEDIELDESFSAMVLRLIDEKHMTDSECYKKANIDRKLFSKIRSNEHYNPSKNTALALAIALKLDYDQTQELLKKAGYTLSHSYLSDVIIEYFIVRKRYDIFEINQVLFEYDQKLLGAVK